MRENNTDIPGKEIPALLVAGGRPINPGAITALISRGLQGIEKPVVAYIGTPNGDSMIFFQIQKAMLKSAGAGKIIFVHLAKNNPDLSAARKILNDADVIFLSGGEVEDGIMWLEKHKLTEFLKSLYSSGKRFMGVSAGVIMMGNYWVHWDVPEDDSTSKLFDCLAFTPLLFDVHGEDENWVELKAALKLLGPGARAYGLASGSMVSADSRGNLAIMSGKYLVFVNEGGTIRTENE